MKDIEKIVDVYFNKQYRFELWAKEDEPITVVPESLIIGEFTENDLDDLSILYMNVFNAQNKRKYGYYSEAKLAWDENPWNIENAKEQLLEELNSQNSFCFVA